MRKNLTAMRPALCGSPATTVDRVARRVGLHNGARDTLKHVILAVDTSLGTSVAIVRDGEVLASLNEPNPLGHAEVIGGLLQRLLAAAGVPASAITTVATGMGPGPFTGLRVGIAAARAFAIGVGAPVYPVPSHAALALAQLLDGVAGEFAVVTDARRREVAVTTFDGLDADGIPRIVTPTELVLRATAFPPTDDAQVSHLTDSGAQNPSCGLPERVVECTQLEAGALGLVAERGIAAGVKLTSGEPLYLRAPDVAAPKVVRQ